jgi:hypothetical protein
VKVFDRIVTSLDFFRFSMNNNILAIYFGTNALKWLNIEKNDLVGQIQHIWNPIVLAWN